MGSDTIRLGGFPEVDIILGLGDGTGMNYMTTSGQIVESLNSRQRELN